MNLALTVPASSSSVLAFVTTVHLALAALRNHRRPNGRAVRSLALISLICAALPWMFPSVLGLLLGLGVHAVWFAACEALVTSKGESPSTPAVETTGTKAELGVTRSRPPANRTGLTHFTPLPILAVVDETPSIKTIRLARPEGFDFEPGQFITVRVRVDGHEHARCYSLSSSPDARGYLEVSVRRQGVVSNALHSLARPGTSLTVKGPLGAFKYPAADDRPLVLLAGGIGITPLISMLRHAVSVAPGRPVTLLYSAHHAEDFAFRDELSSLARRHPQVRVQLAASAGPTAPQVYPGRLDESLLRTTVPDLVHSICFICGPTPMIDGMRALLARLDVAPAQIRYEVFNAAIAASNEAPKAKGAGRPTGSKSFQMTCARTGRGVRIASGQTLLEAAEGAQIPMESMCRAGVCGTCRVQVTGGEVTCDSDTLDDRDRDEGFVLACVATAVSDCTVNV